MAVLCCIEAVAESMHIQYVSPQYNFRISHTQHKTVLQDILHRSFRNTILVVYMLLNTLLFVPPPPPGTYLELHASPLSGRPLT